MAGTAEQLSPQQVAVVLQEGQVEVPEELHVLVLHTQLLRRVPVDHLGASYASTGRGCVCVCVCVCVCGWVCVLLPLWGSEVKLRQI